MENYLFDIIEQDIDSLLLSVSSKYGTIYNFSLDSLNNYKLNKLIFHKTKLSSHNRAKNFIPPNNFRCDARIWGGKNSVIKENGSWKVGYRCSRYKIKNSCFCKQHLSKQPHGIYNLPPPHNHYDKYKFD